MMMGQLQLFRVPRRRPGPRGGPLEPYTATGIGAAGWDGAGQFYWDLRRWLGGMDPTVVDEPVPARRRRREDLVLTQIQVAYFNGGGR